MILLKMKIRRQRDLGMVMTKADLKARMKGTAKSIRHFVSKIAPKKQ